MITQCCIEVLYQLGEEGKEMVQLAKTFERRLCGHLKPRGEIECLTLMAGPFPPSCFQPPDEELMKREIGKDNLNHYIIATQSLELRQELRKVPGLPIIYLARSVVLLETPSDQTLQKKLRVSFLLSFHLLASWFGAKRG